jgi:hypothetical protein
MRLQVVDEGARLFVCAAALVAHEPVLPAYSKPAPANQKQIPLDVKKWLNS